MVSCPELGSGPPIGSDRESGCDTLSPSESGNNLNLSASSVTPLYLIVSQTSRKLVKCKFGFSLGNSWNKMF